MRAKRKDRVAEQVCERLPCEGHPKFVGMRPVHLDRLPGLDDLGKEHLSGRAMAAAPRLHAALERAQSACRRLIVVRQKTILGEVEGAVSGWRGRGRTLGMTDRELDQFSEAFEHLERDAARIAAFR